MPVNCMSYDSIYRSGIVHEMEKNVSWSVDGQTPEFLAATRMISLNDSLIKTILSYIKLEPGMRVLDVGCGSGEYCFRLGSAVEGVHFTGLDIDPAFVEFATKRVTGEIGYPFEEPNQANGYFFICGDGLELPFKDGEFDIVISHTYLTAVPDWACAFAEMCRVCKPRGLVSSVTSLTDDFYGTGTISLFGSLLDSESVELLELVDKAKEKLGKRANLANGIFPRKVPVSFDWIGLENITCAPLPQYFCLSDASVTESERKRYVELLALMETNQIARMKAHPETAGMLSEDQWGALEDLVHLRRAALAECAQNREWNWYGNASLLVCGTVPAEGIPNSRLTFREESRKARQALQSCLDDGLVTQEETTQLGPGRCVKTTLTRSDGSQLTVYGFDPPRALMEACGIICENEEEDYLKVEEDFRNAHETFDDFPAFPNAEIYNIPDVWESVSETALSHVRTTFKDAGDSNGCRIVVCTIDNDDRPVIALAAHPDYKEAAMRALSRALGGLQSQSKTKS